MIDIAHTKGYAPICCEGVNVFFVRNDLSHLFSEVPQDVVTLWRDCWRNAPYWNHDYFFKMRQRDQVIKKFEGDLGKRHPITRDF